MDVSKIIHDKFPNLELIRAFDFASQTVCIVKSKKIKNANYDGQFLLSVFSDGTVHDFDMKIAEKHPKEFNSAMRSPNNNP